MLLQMLEKPSELGAKIIPNIKILSTKSLVRTVFAKKENSLQNARNEPTFYNLEILF